MGDDTLTYAAKNLPSGAAFDSNTRRLTWTPSAADVGIHRVTFVDGDQTDSEEVPILVEDS